MPALFSRAARCARTTWYVSGVNGSDCNKCISPARPGSLGRASWSTGRVGVNRLERAQASPLVDEPRIIAEVVTHAIGQGGANQFPGGIFNPRWTSAFHGAPTGRYLSAPLGCAQAC